MLNLRKILSERYAILAARKDSHLIVIMLDLLEKGIDESLAFESIADLEPHQLDMMLELLEKGIEPQEAYDSVEFA